ncbi:unnamed protein product [Trichobilharzia regenti]|nr:unnamed protein product [Trichobilharzia regenti]
MGWYLQSLYVSLPTLGKMYQFECNEWLSMNRGDKRRTQSFKISEQNIYQFPRSKFKRLVDTFTRLPLSLNRLNSR